MSKPVIIGAKLNLKRTALNTLLEDIKAINIRSEEVLKAIDDAETEEDLGAVEVTADTIQAELDTKTEEKTKLEEEIAALEMELEQLNEKEPVAQVEGERKMENITEVRSAIKEYVQSKGAKNSERAGFTSVEGGALIPTELLKAQNTPSDELDLSKLVNVVPVTSGAGKYPVIKKSGKKMSSVAELIANPELAKPVITEVLYDVVTYRGYIPVSQEVIDDADYPVSELIADEINDQDRNTKNFQIAAILKTATAKAVTGLDGIKAMKNKSLKKVYAGKFVITSSLYNALDTLKDLDGKYILQSDITVDSGMKLLGKECEVVDDTTLGIDGALVGFYGDPKAFMTLFDRKKASVKWVDNDIYGELLASFVRFDAKKVDSDAGFFFTYTAAV